MEIKVFCNCQAKFKFDIEPVNGRMPVPVKCPVCGQDATENANVAIAQKLAETQAAAPVAIPAPVVAAPRVVVPTATAAPVARVAVAAPTAHVRAPVPVIGEAHAPIP